MESGFLANYLVWIWIATGFTLVFFEVVFGFPMVLFICGLAAFVTALAIWAWPQLNDMALYQVVIFLAGIIIWTLALWKPLKNALHKPKGNKSFSSFVGQTAVVDGGNLNKGKTGSIRWSGTIVKARLSADSASDTAKTGDEVIVVDVKENIFIVKPKN